MRVSRIVTLFAVSAVVFLHAQPSMAAQYFFSLFGSGSTCSQSSPCDIVVAAAKADVGGEISCADNSNTLDPVTISRSLIIDCAGTTGSLNALTITAGVVKLRNLTMWNVANTIQVQGGTLIMENVHVAGASGGGILLGEPSSAATITVKNCVFDSAGFAVLLKPNAGGALSVRFDHVTISGNTGGGIKIDTTNGPVTADVTDSEISSNGGNGLNAVGGAGGPAMFNISRSVVANNGLAGIQVNGATAAAMVDTTLLDSDASGATSVVNGGHMLTYGNNRIVGSSGSGFTGTAGLQ